MLQSRSFLLGFALFGVTACAGLAPFIDPVESLGTSSDALPFGDPSGAEFVAGWNLGGLTGVTPELYEVELERGETARTGGVAAFTGNAGATYQTLWHEVPLQAGTRQAQFLELSYDQKLGDARVRPMGWMRCDRGDEVLNMIDTRSLKRPGPGEWERVTLAGIVPADADGLVVGLGILGEGQAWFGRVEAQLGNNANARSASPEAKAYIDDVLDTIESQAMNSANIAWPELRADVESLTRGAASSADTYPTIRYVLGLLEDHHSRLLAPAFLADLDADDEIPSAGPQPNMPRGEIVDGDVGYLWMPGILSFNDDGLRDYASKVARLLESMVECRGFVVDLRDNGGGNMWPMLAGVGPLLGAEVVGAFVEPDGSSSEWRWHLGASWNGATRRIRPEPSHTAEFPADIPVALLTSRRTGSSGEALLVSFLGRRNSRTFGQATAGLSTANSSIPLQDGALLLLTTGVYEDRTGARYGKEIEPDVLVDPHAEDEADTALQSALDWLAQISEDLNNPNMQKR